MIAVGAPTCHSKMARGVRYQSRNSRPPPWVSRAVVGGRLRMTWVRIRKLGQGRLVAERTHGLPKAGTIPPTSTVAEASNIPTGAMPSVANSEALRVPSLQVSMMISAGARPALCVRCLGAPSDRSCACFFWGCAGLDVLGDDYMDVRVLILALCLGLLVSGVKAGLEQFAPAGYDPSYFPRAWLQP